jgi:SAM-dependent methyltransferase
MWAVLSDPNRKGRWDLRQFMETGAREISLLLYQLRTLGIAFDPAAALDFGCGLGRLTQPLGDAFDRVIGVDVSPEMVRLASDLNRHPGRVRYVANVAEDLQQFQTGEFTFVHSDIVLQHIEPRIAAGYIREFFRVTAPGGLVVFHVSSHPRPIETRTQQHAAMPDDAYRASIALTPVAETVLSASTDVAVHVALKNASAHEWSQPRYGSIRVGNHWRSATGAMLVLPQAAPSGGDGEPDPADPGPFPMHGIHTDVIVELISDAGADLLHVASDDRLPEWVAYRYFARRRA